MATRSCPSCGTQYVATVRRCIDCGSTLVDDTTTATAADAKSATGSDDRGQIGYELPGWGNQLKVALEGMLEKEGVPRVWEATVLLVPAEFEDTVDGLIEAVEGREVPEPDEDEPLVALEIEGLDQDTVDALEARLMAEGVPHLWSDEGDLLLGEDDEEKVLALIDAVFDEVEEGGGSSVDSQAVLSGLYVAVDRLMKRPDDEKLRRAFRTAAEPIDEMPVPYGFELASWQEVVRRTTELVTLSKVDQDPDGSGDDEDGDSDLEPVESAADVGDGGQDRAGDEDGEDEPDGEGDEASDAGLAEKARVLREQLREIV
ncbi:MAG: hypothetical protein KDB02_07100 [Acidimicrobiales bacterium]|nr:hypothetical protein [Acidimicrobiales bacterium]